MTWVVLGILSAIFASLVAIFGKLGLGGIDSTLATTLRSIIMAGFLILVAASFGKFQEFHAVGSRAWLFITLSGIAGAMSWLCYFLALRLGGADGVAALDRTSIVFVVVLASLFLGESLSWKTAAGAGMMALGAILIVLR